MHLSEAASILIAQRPIARTEVRTKLTSTSVAYLFQRRQNKHDAGYYIKTKCTLSIQTKLDQYLTRWQVES